MELAKHRPKSILTDENQEKLVGFLKNYFFPKK
jgi:hypothetical protein